jgi:16S rRNA (guanine966-N2)-methyltransferase
MLRIVGGQLRGRRIAAPKGRHTRPTSELVREGIFNTLAAWVDWEDAVALDLFAGSGALGIEALSRGARLAVFVESHGRTAGGIRANLEQLGLAPEAWRVVVARVESWLRKPTLELVASLVLLDPPYAFGGYAEVLGVLADSPLVAPGAVIVVEMGRGNEPALPPGLAPLRRKRYGDTQVWFLLKGADASASSGPEEPP